MRKYALQRFKGFNSSCLLWGKSGSGKSGTLSYLVSWAHENNWVVINLPRVRKFVTASIIVERHINGLYLQNQFAKELLEDLYVSNEQKFEEIKVNLDTYGKFDMTGISDDEPEPCPRIWDKQRRTWSDSWKDFLSEYELQQIDMDTPRMKSRISDTLKEPKTLADIAKQGIEDQEQATCAIAEIMHQLYNQDQANVLVAVDGYSDFFRPSEYTSFRYANSGYNIPPYDIALCRLFMKFDGHMIRNGVKICTSTLENYYAHVFTPDMIDTPEGFHAEMQPLHLNEMRYALNYFFLTKRMNIDIKEGLVEDYHVESQGNWRAMWEKYWHIGITGVD